MLSLIDRVGFYRRAAGNDAPPTQLVHGGFGFSMDWDKLVGGYVCSLDTLYTGSFISHPFIFSKSVTMEYYYLGRRFRIRVNCCLPVIDCSGLCSYIRYVGWYHVSFLSVDTLPWYFRWLLVITIIEFPCIYSTFSYIFCLSSPLNSILPCFFISTFGIH